MKDMLEFDMTDRYKGMGVSQGLDRGLLVYHDETLLIEEGMGLGACALQTGSHIYFTSIKSIEKLNRSYEVIYRFDKKLVWSTFGIRSELLTKILHHTCANIYMKLETKQEALLKFGEIVRKIFRAEPIYVKVNPQGEVRVIYVIDDDEIAISLSCETLKVGCKLYVMNELGANIFDKGIVNGVQSTPPSGWQKVNGFCELFSCSRLLAFTMVETFIPDNIQTELYWGREMGLDYCWAGFEAEITNESGTFDHYCYSIQFREVAT